MNAGYTHPFADSGFPSAPSVRSLVKMFFFRVFLCVLWIKHNAGQAITPEAGKPE